MTLNYSHGEVETPQEVKKITEKKKKKKKDCSSGLLNI